MSGAHWDVQLAPRVRRELEAIRDRSVVLRLRSAVEGPASSPLKGKPLSGHPGLRSLRVATSGGEFRVLYTLHERCALIAMIGSREDIYGLLEHSGIKS